MEYREYGKTGKKVSLMGFGGNRFPEEKYKTEEGISECADLVKKAFDLGINYFDMSHSYCDGQCQNIFRTAFRDMDHTSFYISEKSMLRNDPDEKTVLARIEKTLKTLDVEWIDFFHMWSVLNLDQYKDIRGKSGPLDGAIRAKKEGLIHHICFSTHCRGDETAEIIRDGVFEGVTIGYNLLNHAYTWEGIEAAANAGIGIAIMNPLAGGIIPANPQYFSSDKKEPYSSFAAVETAMEFVCGEKGVSTVLNGISSERELYENAGFFEKKHRCNTQVMKNSFQGCFPHLCTGCRYCTDCPQQIPIPQLMQSYNQYLLTNQDPETLSRYLYDIYGIEAERQFSCISCGKCETQCTQHLPIVERIQEINRIADKYMENLKQRVISAFADSHRKKTGVYAIGPYAKRLFSLYESIYGTLPTHVFLFDSDPNKWGSEPLVPGIKVLKPSKLRELKIRKIIVASEANYKAIHRSLQDLEQDGVEIIGMNLGGKNNV